MTRVRWRVVLPVVMFIVSTLLMLLAKKQQSMLWKAGSGWEVPARSLNCIINGPGFGLTAFIPAPMPRGVDSHLDYDGARLLGIVLFWFLIGWSLDRRRTGQSLGQRHPIPIGILFALGALVCGVLGIGLGVIKFSDSVFWTLVTHYPLRTSESMTLALVVWWLVLFAYFCRRAFILFRQSFVKSRSAGAPS